MPIDKAELATELEKNPEIEKIATEALAKKGFVIRDKATDTTFMENYKKDVIEKGLGAEVSKIYSSLDSDIESIYGVKRNQDEKTFDYNKRAAKEKLDALNGKIGEYEKLIKEKGDPSGVLQKKIEELELKAKTAIEDRDNKIKTLTEQNGKATKGILLQQDYSEISKMFIKQLPPMFDELSKMVLNEAIESAVLKDGKLYIGDGTGGIKKDAAFKEISVMDHLKVKFKDVIDVARKQGGAGSQGGFKGAEGDIDPNTINKDTFIMPETVRNQGDLMEVMIKMGLKRGTENFDTIWEKFANGVEITVNNGKKEKKQVGKALPFQ